MAKADYQNAGNEDITERMHTILGSCMKDREADMVMLALSVVVQDTEEGSTFANLLQLWIERCK